MYREPYQDQEPGQAYYEDVPPGHTQPYPPPASLRLSEPAPAPRRVFPWLAVACCLVSIASLALAAWVWSAQSSARQVVAHGVLGRAPCSRRCCHGPDPAKKDFTSATTRSCWASVSSG